MPVVVIDAVNTATPVTYDVHTDHLMRMLKMTNATQAVAWDAVWKPFGETFSTTSAPKLDLGFPGQWTQSKNGLAWNWHRHYDPTTGRYTKPDPLRFVDGPGFYAYVRARPNSLTDKQGLMVRRCCRAAKIAMGLVEHCWIETDTKTGDAGGVKDGPSGQGSPELPFYSDENETS